MDTRPLTPGARRILETASGLFYRHGIHAVGVDRIAAESGVTKRTLYDRFGAKDALVTAYLTARHEVWWAMLEELIARAGRPKTLALFDAYAGDLLMPDRGCAFLNAAAELDDAAPAYAVVRAHKRAVRERLGELVRADLPELDRPGELVDHLFLLLEGGIAHRGIDGDNRLLVTARRVAATLLGNTEAQGSRGGRGKKPLVRRT